MLIVALSGAYNAWIQLPGVSALWTTPYGRVLAVKLAVVLGLVWLGAINRYAIVPRLAQTRRSSLGLRLFRLARFVLRGPVRRAEAPAATRLLTTVTREAGLATLVFACTAVLSESTPARHARHAAHAGHSHGAAGPFYVTMEELHESGGVPRRWIFAPPEGDPERGRRVFARLECFACHTVRGEGFPQPTGRGPDLTGMGAHRPAGYLAEAIMNPNAVIVEGPGYTGPDGRSIMPDYRESLTLVELIDLVAYLASLGAGGDQAR